VRERDLRRAALGQLRELLAVLGEGG
jgi:hypothetical protein